MPRAIMAFNGDLESRLALHWLVHERGYQIVTLSLNLGQEIHLEELGELALELGATAAQVLDRREVFLREFALPVLQADAVYQQSCFLGSALARYLIAQELVRVAHDENCDTVAHSAASKGNDQVRMETAIASLDTRLRVLAPVREWNLKSHQDKLTYARRRRLPLDERAESAVVVDRNLWGVSLYLHQLTDAWQQPPEDAFVLTCAPEKCPEEPAQLTISFHEGVPVALNGAKTELLALVRELNRLGGMHGVGRTDVVEDRLLPIKSREFYEAPTPTILLAAHRDLESLVQSRELVQFRATLSQRYAELVYAGLWFGDLRESLQQFFKESQKRVTGEVRLRLCKGSCAVLGRRSPYSLYDSRLASQMDLEFFDNKWAEGYISLWTLPARMAAKFRK